MLTTQEIRLKFHKAQEIKAMSFMQPWKNPKLRRKTTLAFPIIQPRPGRTQGFNLVLSLYLFPIRNRPVWFPFVLFFPQKKKAAMSSESALQEDSWKLALGSRPLWYPSSSATLHHLCQKIWLLGWLVGFFFFQLPKGIFEPKRWSFFLWSAPMD